MNLTENERKTLIALVKNARASDSEIGKMLRITPQGAGKIRKKLENAGVIKGYHAKLDYEAIGIENFAVALVTPTIKGWSYIKKGGLAERVKQPHIIDYYVTPNGDAPLIVTYGFRSSKELDEYFRGLRENTSEYLTMTRLFPFSNTGMAKHTANDLFIKVLQEYKKEKAPAIVPIRM